MSLLTLTVRAAIRLVSASLTTDTSQTLVAGVIAISLIPPVLDAVLTKGAIIKELAGPRHYTEMTRREFLHAPRALSWKTGRKVVHLIDPAPSPLGGWRGRVELVVELVVDFDVSCCLLDHFVSHPCGTEAVIIDQCSSRNRKVCTSSFWEPQLSQGYQSRSITFESNQGSKSSRKGINNIRSKWRILYCDSQLLPRSKMLPGPSKIFSGLPFL